MALFCPTRTGESNLAPDALDLIGILSARRKIGSLQDPDASRLAFAAPAIVEAICQGRQPAELNAETLLNRIDLPLEWSAQLKALGGN